MQHLPASVREVEARRAFVGYTNLAHASVRKHAHSNRHCTLDALRSSAARIEAPEQTVESSGRLGSARERCEGDDARAGIVGGSGLHGRRRGRSGCGLRITERGTIAHIGRPARVAGGCCQGSAVQGFRLGDPLRRGTGRARPGAGLARGWHGRRSRGRFGRARRCEHFPAVLRHDVGRDDVGWKLLEGDPVWQRGKCHDVGRRADRQQADCPGKRVRSRLHFAFDCSIGLVLIANLVTFWLRSRSITETTSE
jgi:hypothetical protein